MSAVVKRYWAFQYNDDDPAKLLGDGPGVPQAQAFVYASAYDALLTETRWAMQQLVYMADDQRYDRAKQWLDNHPEPPSAAPGGGI